MLSLEPVIWDGGGDNNWQTAANWVDDVAPVTNDDLIFPVVAAQTSNFNGFPAGTSFGSILIEGNNYDLSGNSVVLNGSVTNNGTGNTFGIDVEMGSTGGFANSSASTFTVTGDINTAGNALTLNSAVTNVTTLFSGSISGSGSVVTGGSGITVLAGDNSYLGTTT